MSRAPDACSGTVTDAAWQAIVSQLLATPSQPDSDAGQLAPEYAWARRLGLHINRPPKRR